MARARQRASANGAAREPYPRQKRAAAGVGASASSLLIWFAAGALLSVGGYLAYRGYMERRVNTPFNAPKAAEVPRPDDRYWGTYRPGVYLGLKTRHRRSPVAGLIWLTPAMFQGGELPLRHWCEQGDNLSRYGWLQHDGRHFGVQELVDKHVTLETSFVKQPGGRHGGDWTARVKVTPKSAELSGLQVSLLFYVALDDDAAPSDWLSADASGDTLRSIRGGAEAVGDFQMTFSVDRSRLQRQFYLAARTPGLHQIRETVVRGFRLVQTSDQKYIGLVGEMPGAAQQQQQPNLVVYQAVVSAPCELEIRYESASGAGERVTPLSGALYDQLLAAHRQQFQQQFEDKFGLAEKGYDAEAMKFAQAAMSNMIGGIGYFHGASLVQSRQNAEPVPYWAAPLYTAVPSRSFFPRGFLWDEGFHNLLIAQWDAEISRDIIAHWLDLMNVEGWIPREQILGSEARSKVPAEFVVQRNTNANPPTLLLPLHALVRQMDDRPAEQDVSYLRALWPRLKAWYSWFNTTQAGELPGTYRWRGRDPHVEELNPKTLTSGLDDYPRASHPNADERHVDLRCWMTLASALLADIADRIGEPATAYRQTHAFLSDGAALERLHWSPAAAAFADFGLHTDSVRLVRRRPDPADRQQQQQQQLGLVRRADRQPELRFVDAHGYVSLFPLLLQVLEPGSAALGRLIADLRRPDLLWTPHGLRSLAKTAPLYMKKNTEHDPPYWRGPVWVNMNFLAVRALRYYADTPGPHSQAAREVYTELRHNLVSNVMKEYRRTGFVWEQYNDRTGWGQGCRPFTGWSALVVLIMAESY